MRLELGLDQPIIVQYWTYLKNVLSGDFGTSVLTSHNVLDDVLHFFPATLELATVATILGVAIGVPMGVYAATRQGRLADHVIRVVGLVGYSVPVFWLGLVGLLVFYVWLDLAAGPGRLDLYYDGLVEPVTGLILVDSALAGEWEVFRNALSHLVLPAAILGYFSLAYIARMTRSFMLDQLRQEYVTTARVKGLTERRVVWRHAFGNIAVPLITVVALTYAQPARRLGADRDRVRLARPRPLHHQLAVQRRHERGARRHHRGRHLLHRPQHVLRPALPHCSIRGRDDRTDPSRSGSRAPPSPGGRAAGAE